MFAQSGQLYVGDSQLGSMFNRASIHRAGDFYLSPLSRKQVSEQQLMAYVESVPEGYKALPSIFTDEKEGRAAAYFHECSASLHYDF